MGEPQPPVAHHTVGGDLPSNIGELLILISLVLNSSGHQLLRVANNGLWSMVQVNSSGLWELIANFPYNRLL